MERAKQGWCGGALVAMVLVAAVGAGCGPVARGSGSARITVACAGQCAATVSRVTVTVSKGDGADFAPIAVELVKDGDAWSGSVPGVLAGSGRQFDVVAYGGDGTEPLYRGSAKCEIVDGAAASISIVLSTPGGLGPTILSLVTARSVVAPGGSMAVAVVASDPGGGAISYQWSTTCGTFTAPTLPSTTWTAPAAEGSCQLTIAVTSSGGSSVAYATVRVGTVDLCASVTCPAAADLCHLAGACNPATGQCSAAAAKACTASDACHVAGACDTATGQCATETARTCPAASNLCHVPGTCSVATGQCSAETAKSCSTGQFCDVADGQCKQDLCVSVTCPPASDLCHLAGSCSPATGQCAAETARTCTASDRCHVAGACVLASGQCSAETAVVCTGTDVCDLADGVCKPPAALAPTATPQRADGQLVTEALGLSYDATGAIYRAGGLAAPFDFGSGTVTPAGADLWFGKFDPATGAAIWAFGYGDANDQFANGAAVSSSRVGIIGNFFGTLDLGGGMSATDPDPVVALQFVALFNPASANATTRPAATLLKTINLGGGGLTRIASAPALTRFAICGTTAPDFAATDLVPGAVTGGGMDIVVAVIDETGTTLWSKQIGGTGNQSCSAVALDDAGNLLMTGQYGAGVLDFGAGALSPSPTGANQNVYVARFNGTTGALVQAVGFGSASGRSAPFGLAVAANGDVAVSGSVLGRITFGATTIIGTGTASTDAWVAKLNSADLSVATGWPVRIGGPSGDAANAVAFDVQGQLWVAGIFTGVTTSPGPDGRGAVVLTSAGGTDAFLVRFSPAGVATFSASYGDAFGQWASTLISTRLATAPANSSIWMGGMFGNSITFPPLPALTTTGGVDVRNFLVKYQ